MKVKAWDKSWAESKKMGSFLSVARGSCEPPVFLELSYSGAPDQEKPVVLVGKFFIYVDGTDFAVSSQMTYSILKNSFFYVS